MLAQPTKTSAEERRRGETRIEESSGRGVGDRATLFASRPTCADLADGRSCAADPHRAPPARRLQWPGAEVSTTRALDRADDCPGLGDDVPGRLLTGLQVSVPAGRGRLAPAGRHRRG